MASALLFGGGGMTHGEDPRLEDALAALLPAGARIGYIGHANDDHPDRLERVRRRCADIGLLINHLPKEASVDQALNWSEGLDAIYVGGGNTEKMLRHWRDSGIAEVLLDAARRGVLLSGVSAGAVCWFEFALWDGNGIGGYRPLKGLGLFSGSCCPHYTSERARAVSFHEHVDKSQLPGGYAIGDGAGLLFIDHLPPRAITARGDTGAWRLEHVAGALSKTQVPRIEIEELSAWSATRFAIGRRD